MHMHAEHRSPNNDEGAKFSHFLRTHPCVLNVRYMLRQQFEICMMIFLLRAHAGRLAFVDLFFTYIDLTSHVFVVSVLCIFKNPFPAQETL